jgi:hypothetical protein
MSLLLLDNIVPGGAVPQRRRAGGRTGDARPETWLPPGGAHPYRFIQGRETTIMLWTITIILFVLWALGMVSGATMGWWIHLLLVLAVIALIFAVIRRGAATV